MTEHRKIELPTFFFGPDGRGRDFRMYGSSIPRGEASNALSQLALYTARCAQNGLWSGEEVWACFPIENGKAAIICRTFFNGPMGSGHDCTTNAVYVSPENLAAFSYRTDLIASQISKPKIHDDSFTRTALKLEVPSEKAFAETSATSLNLSQHKIYIHIAPEHDPLQVIGRALAAQRQTQETGNIIGWATHGAAVRSYGFRTISLVASSQTTPPPEGFLTSGLPVPPQGQPRNTVPASAPAPLRAEPVIQTPPVPPVPPAPQPRPAPSAAPRETVTPPPQPAPKTDAPFTAAPFTSAPRSQKPHPLKKQWRHNANTFAQGIHEHRIKLVSGLAAIGLGLFGLYATQNSGKLSGTDLAAFKDMQQNAAYQTLPTAVQARGTRAADMRDPEQMVAFYKESSFALSKTIASLKTDGPADRMEIEELRQARNQMLQSGVNIAETYKVCSLAARQIDRDANALSIVTKHPGALQKKCAAQLAR